MKKIICFFCATACLILYAMGILEHNDTKLIAAGLIAIAAAITAEND